LNFPRFEFPWRRLQRGWFHPRLIGHCYDWFFSWLGRFDKSALANNFSLVNSGYTKKITDRCHNADSVVLNPPACGRPSNRPWAQRGDAVLCIGIFVPEKRLIEVMGTVNELRLAGHEMQLHIAGSADQSKYRRRLVAAAARHHWVNLHEGLSRTALDELASHCR